MATGSISVVIPHYNHLPALRRSLLSLTKQKLVPLEVIVVDDGSTEGDVESVVLEFPALPIRLVLMPHQGASAARNRGFKESRGEFVIFWDADTLASPEFLLELKRALEKTPAASFAYASYCYGIKKMAAKKFDYQSLCENNYIDTTSLVRKKDLAEIAGPFDESLARFQDWDLWLTLAERGKTGVWVPRVLYKKIVSAKKGISTWLPSFAYRLPWTPAAVKSYQAAKLIVQKKHHLV